MSFKSYVILFLFISAPLLGEEPWGKDADLVHKTQENWGKGYAYSTPKNALGLAHILIKFHQEIISEADGPRSHYKPSSSQYTLMAMKKYGVLWGFIKGCDRLTRENSDPWLYEMVEFGGDLFKLDLP